MRRVTFVIKREDLLLLRQRAQREETTVSRLVRLAVGRFLHEQTQKEGSMITINIKDLYGETAKISDLPAYIEAAKGIAGEGNDVVLTGPGPVWLYLAIAHALHGVARSLTYDSPASGPVPIFDHNPF